MPLIEVPETPSGLDLKFVRMRAGLRQQDVAVAMGRARSAISEIEGARAPSAETVKAYLDAVLACATTGEVPTIQKAG